jgi:hypothetical protein
VHHEGRLLSSLHILEWVVNACNDRQRNLLLMSKGYNKKQCCQCFKTFLSDANMETKGYIMIDSRPSMSSS